MATGSLMLRVQANGFGPIRIRAYKVNIFNLKTSTFYCNKYSNTRTDANSSRIHSISSKTHEYIKYEESFLQSHHVEDCSSTVTHFTRITSGCTPILLKYWFELRKTRQ